MSNTLWNVLIVGYFILGLVAIRASYFSGVEHGYKYLGEPENPEYKLAKKYIERFLKDK